MPAIRRILIAVKDPTAASLPAVAKGARLAQLFGASIELCHCISDRIYSDPYFDYGNYIVELEREIETRRTEALEALAARLRKDGLKVSATVEWDYPAHEALVRRARKGAADLIVAECHAGRRRLTPWLLHLTDWELLRTSPVPVLLVKNDETWNEPVVLAAVDPAHAFSKPSKLDAGILELASTFSDALGGSLQVMHSYVPVPPRLLAGIGASGRPASEVAAEVAIEAAARAKKGLQQALEAFGQTRIPRHLVPGKPVEAIPQVARDLKCGILVMGAISRSGLKRVIIGNTAERVLGTVRCDVLVVKPEAFKSPVSPRSRGVRYSTVPQWDTPR